MNETVKIVVTGKVQGVWFRRYTQNKAQELGISGTVQNLNDGSVLIIATGTDTQLTQLTAWCKRGSPKAIVQSVNIHKIPTNEFKKFSIL
ncbi:MAG: acylphosphatase [Niabella sp.]